MRDELAVGVAADQQDPVAERDQRVEHLDRLGAGREVAGDDHELGVLHRRLGQHGEQHRQHAVHVGQQRHRHRSGIPSPRSPSGRGPRTRRSDSSIATSLMLASRRRM